MAWLPIILIYSVIAASVQALPSTTRDYEAEFYPESLKEYMGQTAQHVQKPLVMLMKDKSNQKSPTIEFVYKDQEKRVEAQKGTDRERYMHNQNSIKTDNSKTNITENIKQSDSKNDITGVVNTNGPNNINSAHIKEKNSFIQNFKKQDGWLLFPNELSSITSHPRYFYGILPLSPFPTEEPISKENIVFKDKLEISQPTLIQRTSQPPQVAGPMLYPQSIYSREFDLPFFD